MLELSPIVFAEAEHDEVAAEIVDRLADEVVALARTALARLGLETLPVEVLLGGGLLAVRIRAWSSAIARVCGGRSPVASVRVTGTPPIVGATLLALDSAGAGPEAQAARPGRGRWRRRG